MPKVWPRFLSIAIAACCIAHAQPPEAEQPSTPQTAAQPAPEGPPAALVREGNALFGQQAFEAALGKYDQARKAVPDSAELAFNRGLTQYKLGQLDSAATALNQAVLSSDRRVEGLSKYLLGNIQHNQALQVREQDPQGAIDRLQQATRYYVDALELMPDNDELRANIELAQQLIELIREEQKQQQQQQEQQQDQQEQEQEQQEQQSQQEQDQQQQQQQEEQQQSGEQNEKQEQEQEQQEQQSQEEQDQQQQQQQEEQQEQQQQQGGAEGEQQEQQQQEMGDQEAQDLEQQISQEQAERMFQQIRDKERQRRMQKAQRERRETKPVKKDW